MRIRKRIKYILFVSIFLIAGFMYYKQILHAGDQENKETVFIEDEGSDITADTRQLINQEMVTPGPIIQESKIQDPIIHEPINQDTIIQEPVNYETSKETVEQVVSSELVEPMKTETIFVHVCGAVKDSGVYEIAKGCRVIDAVKAAGGFSDTASKDAVNQAAQLKDGIRLYIPTIEEVKEATDNLSEDTNFNSFIKEESKDVSNDKSIESPKVNINTADKGILMTLQGIGESKAQSIISYREQNGKFRSIQDLLKINGIKDAVYNKIKDSITISD